MNDDSLDDPESFFDVEYCHESFTESIEDILSDKDVVKAEEAFILTIQNSIEKIGCGLYGDSGLKLIYGRKEDA